MERIKKNPDEIKKGLEACSITHKTNDCRNCPYYNLSGCAAKVMVDALALIQQLEAKDAEKDQRIADLEQELAAAKRERDAAVDALGKVPPCENCLHFDCQCDEPPCMSCFYCDPEDNIANHFEWCGVCPDTEVQEDDH